MEAWMKRMALNWINHEERTVCLVSWGNLAKSNYLRAAKSHTKIVGSYLAKLIKSQKLNPSETIVVGHSLGAHISGFCGKELNGALKAIYGEGYQIH